MLLNNQRLKNNQEHNNSYIYNSMTLFEHILIESRVDDFKKMLLKLITQNEINVTVYIGDFFYPPFDNEKIEKIRDHMINVGKFEKSRVSNKSLKE